MLNSRMIAIEGITLLVVTGLILYAGYAWGHRSAERNHLEEQGKKIEIAIKKVETEYQAKMIEKDKVIAARDMQINNLKRDYKDIITRLRSKAAESASILPPMSEAETLKRLEGLGYKAR